MNTQVQEGAIQKDVLTEESNTEVATPAPRSSREIAMEQIELANMRRLEEETGVKFDVAPDPASVPADTPDQTKVVDPAITPAAPTPAPAPEPAATPEGRKVKIDGQEVIVSDDELVRSYQKNAAADRRLEEASRVLREAQERAAQLQVQLQTIPAADPATAKEPTPDLHEEVKSTLAVIYGGDEEAAAEALTNLLTKNRGGGQPTPAPSVPSVDELAAAVQKRLDVDQAFDRLKTDYPDLLADPNLEQLTAMRIEQLTATGISPAQAMLSAGEEIYKSLGKTPVGRQPDPVVEPAVNARLANKERLDPVRAASVSAVTPEVAAEDNNPSSVISEMAARRLGQSLPRRTG